MMKFDYTDLSAFIEHVVDKASVEGIAISTVDELHGYLEENQTETIHIIEHN